MLRATLFDMDGLLFDSEVLWHRAEVEIFEPLGVPMDGRERSTKGMYVDAVVAYWRERFPWNGPTNAEVVDELLERVGQLVESEGRFLPGAERALDLTGARGPLGLASSTPMPLLRRCLRHFGIEGRFDVICSADAEPYGKPHPGVFLSAAAGLGVAPEECLVLEDSAAGVLAGKAGRMTVVAVPTPEDADRAEFALADLVLDSLESLEPDWLDARFA